MTGFLVFLVWVILSVFAFVWQIRRDPYMTREVVLRSLGSFVGYLLFGGMGLVITLWLVDGPQPPDRTIALTGFLLAWIFFGALWTMRVVPRRREPPLWLMRSWGVADLGLLLIMVSSLAYFLLV